MKEPKEVLPRTMRELEAGMSTRVQIGVQLYISVDAEPVADFGIGEARPGVPMTEDTMMAWYSSTKGVFPIAMAQLWEQGKLDPDDPVCKFIPEYGQKGKETITLRHLMTHTSGLVYIPGMEPEGGALPWVALRFKSWDEFIAKIGEAPREPDWIPGRRAGYGDGRNYIVLTEVLQRITGQSYADYVRENIFLPIEAVDSWIGMPKGKFEEYGERIGLLHDLGADGVPRFVPALDTAEVSVIPCAGGSGRGPMRELGRVYELLLLRGTYKGKRIISPQSVAAITSSHRVGMFDESFRIPVDWGLGYTMDFIHYGRFCSRRTFGCPGGTNSVAYCDPEWGLVVAMVFNGQMSFNFRRDALRKEAVSTAIYKDLRLVVPGDPGRDHPVPPQPGEQAVPPPREAFAALLGEEQ